MNILVNHRVLFLYFIIVEIIIMGSILVKNNIINLISIIKEYNYHTNNVKLIDDQIKCKDDMNKGIHRNYEDYNIDHSTYSYLKRNNNIDRVYYNSEIELFKIEYVNLGIINTSFNIIRIIMIFRLLTCIFIDNIVCVKNTEDIILYSFVIITINILYTALFYFQYNSLNKKIDDHIDESEFRKTSNKEFRIFTKTKGLFNCLDDCKYDINELIKTGIAYIIIMEISYSIILIYNIL